LSGFFEGKGKEIENGIRENIWMKNKKK